MGNKQVITDADGKTFVIEDGRLYELNLVKPGKMSIFVCGNEKKEDNAIGKPIQIEVRGVVKCDIRQLILGLKSVFTDKVTLSIALSTPMGFYIARKQGEFHFSKEEQLDKILDDVLFEPFYHLAKE